MSVLNPDYWNCRCEVSLGVSERATSLEMEQIRTYEESVGDSLYTWIAVVLGDERL